MSLLKQLSQVPALELLRELDRRQVAENRASTPHFDAFTTPFGNSLADLSESAILSALQLHHESKRPKHYGRDSRKDLFEVSDKKRRAVAKCVVAVALRSGLVPSGPDRFTLRSDVYGKFKKLCPNEKFWLQPSGRGIRMTGSLVHPSAILTAGHYISRLNLDKICFIRGWAMNSPWLQPPSIPASDVLYPRCFIDKKDTPSRDWALIRLTQETPGPYITQIQTSGKIADKRALYAVGHPYGLPAKLIDGANVVGNNEPSFFSANLDTYDRNSGSPVFDAITNALVGVHVRGKKDFIYISECGCRISFVVSDFGGPAGECTRITELADILQRV